MLLPRIRERRMEAHMTQKELSDMIGASRPQLSGYEKGKSYPTAIILWRIAVACKCKVDDLYELVDDD